MLTFCHINFRIHLSNRIRRKWFTNSQNPKQNLSPSFSSPKEDAHSFPHLLHMCIHKQYTLCLHTCMNLTKFCTSFCNLFSTDIMFFLISHVYACNWTLFLVSAKSVMIYSFPYHKKFILSLFFRNDKQSWDHYLRTCLCV